MLARSFLIESSSKLLVTRTGIKARLSLISGRIRLLTLELLALEWRKFYTFELEYLWGQLAWIDQILCVASLGVGKGCIMFLGRLDLNSGVHGNRNPPLTYNWVNDVSTFSRLFLTRSFQSFVEFNFGPNQTTHFGVNCPWVTNISHFWTWISLRPVGQSWSNLMCSIIGVGEGCIRFWCRLDRNPGFHGNRKTPLTSSVSGLFTF